ncbi:helix-turn-helix transcriptional regulator [Blautia schinkii]|nr:helix-turn-helix transcriptional regulator [Blautia schinkii]
MTEFSNVLSQFIKEKNIKVYSLVKYCNLDRSTMYKLINGKRNPPTKDIFEKIAEFMHLTPTEYKRFKEAYLITKTGPEIYYRRKSAENFVINFPGNYASEVIPSKILVNPLPAKTNDSINCTVLSTQVEINHFLHHILLAEASRPKGKIALLLQPDYDFLFNLLASLNPSGELRIEQLICLSKTEQMAENNELYNLLYLKMLLPLYFGNVDYHPHFFYEDIHSHYQSFNGLPYIILTSDYAITCTSDYQTGILYRDSAILSMLWDLYYSYQNKCSALFEVLNFLPIDNLQMISKVYKEPPSYILQPEACLTPFITSDILAQALAPGLPDREAVFKQIDTLLKLNRQQLCSKSVHVLFTQEGLLDFARFGKIKEVPDYFYRPLLKKERIAILENMLPYCYEELYLILKKPLNHLSENLHLCVNSSSGYLLFNNIRNQTVCLLFNEPSILAVFLDFLESLDDMALYSGEETALFVKNVINELKNDTL